MVHGTSAATKSSEVSEVVRQTLVGVAATTGGGVERLYMPDWVYDAFVERESKPSLVGLNKIKGVVRQYVCATDIQLIAHEIKAVLGKPFGAQSSVIPVVLLKSVEDAFFIFPERYFIDLGMAVPQADPYRAISARRHEVRSLLHVMAEVCDVLRHVGTQSKESIVREYFAASPRPHDRGRFKKAAAACGALPTWLVRGCIIDYSPNYSDSERSSVASGSSDSSSGRFSVGSASSFSGASDSRSSHVGEKKFNVTALLRLRGLEYVKSCLSKTADGAIIFDLSGEGLTCIDDFSAVMDVVFTLEELFSITALDLSGNELYAIGDRAFSSLSKLQHLTMSNNPLRLIDGKAFAGISCLESLSINHAPELVSIPADVWNSVPRLKVLRIENTSVEDFSGVAILHSLEILSVPQNRISVVPPLGAMLQLRKVDLSGNQIVDLGNGAAFPRNAEGMLSLSLLRLDENRLKSLPSWFYTALPEKGLFVTLCNNSLLDSSADHAAVSVELLKVGFERVGKEGISRGTTVADGISDAIFDDVRSKLCSYLGGSHPSVSSIVEHEIIRNRSVGSIDPMPAQKSFLKRNAVPIVCVAATVILFAAGGGVLGFFFIKKAALTIIAKTSIGAAAGAVAGGLVGGVGAAACSSPPDVRNYLNTGGSTVCMSDGLKKVYIGVFREIALLSLLKQYLVAAALLLEWVMAYDEYTDKPDRIDLLMTKLEADMDLAKKQLFARIDDATTIAMLHQLITEYPMKEIKRHVPADLFNSDTLTHAPLAEDAKLLWIGEEKMELVRHAIIDFAQVARVLRAVLVNRYTGTYDHARVASILCKVPLLQELLTSVVDSVCTPLIGDMEGAGETGEAWYTELNTFKKVAKRLGSFLKKAAKDKNMRKLLHFK